MVIRWGAFSAKSRKPLKTGWLITAGVVALYTLLGSHSAPRPGARHCLGEGGRPCRRGRGLGANLAVATNLDSSALQTRSAPSKRCYCRRFRRPGRRRTRLSHDTFSRR
jgi:hypothetical protein